MPEVRGRRLRAVDAQRRVDLQAAEAGRTLPQRDEQRLCSMAFDSIRGHAARTAIWTAAPVDMQTEMIAEAFRCVSHRETYFWPLHFRDSRTSQSGRCSNAGSFRVFSAGSLTR